MTKNYKQLAKQLGSRGGKKSVQARFKGKTKKEISDMMSKVRTKVLWENVKLTEKDAKHAQKVGEETVKALNSLK